MVIFWENLKFSLKKQTISSGQTQEIVPFIKRASVEQAGIWGKFKRRIFFN